MGSPRSGSTLLNMMLGDCKNVFAAGELCNMVSAMDRQQSFCSCGAVANRCPFWSRARTAWSQRSDGIDGMNYLRIQSRFERLRRYGRRWDSDPLFHIYVAHTQALFRALGEVSGTRTIIDSSKSPIRAMALARIPSVNLRVIHLVRDVRGVACSLMKSWNGSPENGIGTPIAGRSPIRTSAEWLGLNWIANRVRLMMKDRAILIRYEDLVMDPKATLERASVFTGLDLISVLAKLERGEALLPGHVIEGNRLRMQRQVQLRPDVRWRTELSAFQKFLLPVLAGPIAWRYGYRPGT